MTERLQNWWIALSQRERWLVGIAGVLALGVVLWGLGRPAAVSYTHLDVYKRQALSRRTRQLGRELEF